MTRPLKSLIILAALLFATPTYPAAHRDHQRRTEPTAELEGQVAPNDHWTQSPRRYEDRRGPYGSAPRPYFVDPGYRYGPLTWRRGNVLPPLYRGVGVGDYYRYHLRPPPRGYAWYRVGDAFLLTDIGSGLIFEIIRD